MQGCGSCHSDTRQGRPPGHSITYRIAVGPQQGRKVFTLQTLPDERDAYDAPATAAGNVAGFSLHAGVSAKANQRDKLERLCRYITRPAISEKRLSLTNQGKVRYELKTPYRDGTTHVIFEPVDFTAPAHPCARGISASLHVIAKLAALVPKPRVNLTRFELHGCNECRGRMDAQERPRCIRPEQQTPSMGDTSHAGQGQSESRRRAGRENTRATPCGNDVGAPKVGPFRGRLKRVFTNSRRLEATLMWKPAGSAVAPPR